jgi:hypothetical protein
MRIKYLLFLAVIYCTNIYGVQYQVGVLKNISTSAKQAEEDVSSLLDFPSAPSKQLDKRLEYYYWEAENEQELISILKAINIPDNYKYQVLEQCPTKKNGWSPKLFIVKPFSTDKQQDQYTMNLWRTWTKSIKAEYRLRFKVSYTERVLLTLSYFRKPIGYTIATVAIGTAIAWLSYRYFKKDAQPNEDETPADENPIGEEVEEGNLVDN